MISNKQITRRCDIIERGIDGGIAFVLDKPPYCAYARDRIYSVSPGFEEGIAHLIKHLGEDAAEQALTDLRRYTSARLPHKINVHLTIGMGVFA